MTQQQTLLGLGLLLMLASVAALTTPAYVVAPMVPVALLGAIILYRFPEYGLVLLAGLVPLEGLFAGSKLFTGSKLVGLAMLAIVSFRLIIKNLPAENLKSPLWWPIAALALAFICSAYVNGQTPASQYAIKQLFTVASIFFLTLALKDRLPIIWLMRILSLSVVATALMALLTESANVEDRAIGLLTDPNEFALLLCVVLPMTLYLVLYDPIKLLRVFWLGIFAILILAFGKTMSRSGLVVLVLASSVMLFHYRSKLKGWSVAQISAFLILCGFLGAASLGVMPQDYRERILSLVNLSSGVKSSHVDPSLGRRSSYLIVGMDVFKNNPVLGSGPGSFPSQYAKSSYATAFSVSSNNPDLYRRAHNTYMETLAETGLSGILPLIGLLFLAIKQYYQAHKRAMSQGRLAQAHQLAHIGSSMMAIILFMLFLSYLNNKLLWILLAIGGAYLHQIPSLSGQKAK